MSGDAAIVRDILAQLQAKYHLSDAYIRLIAKDIEDKDLAEQTPETRTTRKHIAMS